MSTMKKFLFEVLLNIRVLITPCVWMRSRKADPHWDEIVRTLIKTEQITEFNRFTFKLGELTIWKANGLFNLGMSWNNRKLPDRLITTRKTALLLSDKIRRYKKSKPLEPPPVL